MGAVILHIGVKHIDLHMGAAAVGCSHNPSCPFVPTHH